MIEAAKLEELRGELEEQRENLRKEIVEQGGDPDSDDAAIDVERGVRRQRAHHGRACPPASRS